MTTIGEADGAGFCSPFFLVVLRWRPTNDHREKVACTNTVLIGVIDARAEPGGHSAIGQLPSKVRDHAQAFGHGSTSFNDIAYWFRRLVRRFQDYVGTVAGI
jgi:hypothetical protein